MKNNIPYNPEVQRKLALLVNSQLSLLQRESLTALIFGLRGYIPYNISSKINYN